MSLRFSNTKYLSIRKIAKNSLVHSDFLFEISQNHF